MKKIPTLFRRGDDGKVTDEVTSGCEWVADGEGYATVKFDGTCVKFDGTKWWARREVKPGKTPPEGWIVVDYDDNTGKAMGWEPIENTGWGKYLAEAIETRDDDLDGFILGMTYELCGPKVNGNPEGLSHHHLFAHGIYHMPDCPRDFDGIKEFLGIENSRSYLEGIVWWHPDGRRCKIKYRDYGNLRRPTADPTADTPTPPRTAPDASS